jgi:hypothetical protein
MMGLILFIHLIQAEPSLRLREYQASLFWLWVAEVTEDVMAAVAEVAEVLFTILLIL